MAGGVRIIVLACPGGGDGWVGAGPGIGAAVVLSAAPLFGAIRCFAPGRGASHGKPSDNNDEDADCGNDDCQIHGTSFQELVNWSRIAAVRTVTRGRMTKPR
jgi:hypothetical protein